MRNEQFLECLIGVPDAFGKIELLASVPPQNFTTTVASILYGGEIEVYGQGITNEQMISAIISGKGGIIDWSDSYRFTKEDVDRWNGVGD